MKILTTFCWLLLCSVSLQASTHAGHAALLYWPNKNLGFGHVSLQVFFPDNDTDEPDRYISWALENEQATDFEFHQQDPMVVRIDNISKHSIKKFEKWFTKSDFFYPRRGYGHEYRFLKNNCANAVVHALAHLDCNIGKKPDARALRPHTVYKRTKNFAKKRKARHRELLQDSASQ